MTDSIRMLAPPHHTRRVDVPTEHVKDRMADGFIKDPFPDTRGKRYAEWPDRFKGRPAVVVASGPSTAMLAEQGELTKLIEQTGAVVFTTNDPWRCAKGKPVPSDFLVILDETFWMAWREELDKYLAAHRDCVPCLCFDPMMDVDYHPLNINIHATPDTDPSYEVGCYFHGLSSGIAAIQMAMQAGCDPIYIVGHDCCVANGKTHGFGVRTSEELSGDYPQGKSMLAGYGVLAKHAASLGVRVLNLSGVSALTCFPLVTPQEVISNAQHTQRPPRGPRRSPDHQGKSDRAKAPRAG